MDDGELLRAYREHCSDQAFTELVERHLPLVYGVAMRVVHEPHTAEDVAQAVFIQLARKASSIREGQAVAGWLYRATQHDALDALRNEKRRRQRETEAMKLAQESSRPEIAAEQLTPFLEQAMGQLRRVEQDAVVLRFFQGKSLRETGQALALSEEAARKRVDRALDKMRAYFARCGITASAALLTSALSAHAAGAPAPVGLAAKIAGCSSAGKIGVGEFSHSMIKVIFMNTTAKLAIGGVLVAGLAAYKVGFLQQITHQISGLAGANSTYSESANIVTRSPRKPNSQNAAKASDVAYSSAPDPEIVQLILKGPKLGVEELAKLQPGVRTLDAYKRAFNEWAGDPKQAQEVATLAEALKDGRDRQMALQGAMAAWTFSDGPAALAWASHLAVTDPEALEDALNYTSRTGHPALAAQYVNAIQDATARNQAIQTIAHTLAFGAMGNVTNSDNAAAALGWLDQVATGDTYDTNVNTILNHLAQNNPVAAASLLNEVTEPGVREAAMANLANTWAQVDPQAALNWAQTLPTTDGASAVVSIVTTWAIADPAAAAAFVQNSSNPAAFFSAAPAIAQAWAASNPQAALGFANGLPEGDTKNQALNNILQTVAKSNFTAAWTYAANLPEADSPASAMGSLVGILAPKSPAQAAGLLQQIPGGDAQLAATSSVAAVWAVQDPTAFGQWVNNLPAGAQHDTAVSAALNAAQAAKLPAPERDALAQKIQSFSVPSGDPAP